MKFILSFYAALLMVTLHVSLFGFIGLHIYNYIDGHHSFYRNDLMTLCGEGVFFSLVGFFILCLLGGMANDGSEESDSE